MLRDDVFNQVKDAMRAKDQIKLAAVRYLWSEIKNAEIDAKVELNDEAIVSIVQKEVKKRKDAIEQMKQAGREVEEELVKLKFLEYFLPEQMSREEIVHVVDEVYTDEVKDFGMLMGRVMARVKGKAEGTLVQEVVKEKFRD